MDCSCRTAALRIFVKSVAQIHVPLRATTPRLVPYQLQSPTISSQASRFRNQKALCVPPSTLRALHTSCTRSNAAAQLVDIEGVRSAKPEETGATGAAHGEPIPAIDNAITNDSPDTHRRAVSKEAHPDFWVSEKKATGDKKATARSKRKPADDDGDRPPKKKEGWMIQKAALKHKFPEGWQPRKKLSPDALVGIRMLHQQFPDEYTTEVLAKKFEVSPEAIRRILRSKWTPDEDKEVERQERWFKRGKQVWTQWAALGKKPPRKWRAEGIVRDPSWNRPRGPNHKDKAARAAAQRRLAKSLPG